MKSVMKHDFSRVPTIKAPRSHFDRSHGHKFPFDAGYLIPFYHDPVLPGDTFNLQTFAIVRLNTPEFPLMDNLYLDTQFFFVPYRLIWDNARKFFGEQVNPGDSIDFTLPLMTAHVPGENSLSDYLNLGTATGAESVSHVSLNWRAYNLVWNEWYRDQNLQNSLTVDTGDGPDSIANYTLQRRGKRHDYFTSALPSPQKGDAVTIPLGTTAPIVPSGTGIPTFNYGAVTGRTLYGDTSSNLNNVKTATGLGSATAGDMSWNTASLEVDLTSTTASTVNDFREAFQVQKLLERDARGGTRYSEIVRNHFGVTFYDPSYRPEYLGGGSSRINVTPVANTASTPGALGAYAKANVEGHGFTKSFTEHGIVLGIMSVRADLTYQQGIPREYMKSTRYDIYWPSLAHLGEQGVYMGEIYYTGTAADLDIFGYQERHAEYRYRPSYISGTLRSTAVTPLDAWHLSQEFLSAPSLGPTFIEENPPLDRAVLVPSEPHFIADTYQKLLCARPMPVNGVPGFIDHF